MDKHPSRQPAESTNLFDGNRSGEIVPPDNLSDARLPARTQRACDHANGSDRVSNNYENEAFRAGYRMAYRDGFEDGQSQRNVRVGRGQGSMCPEYNDYANSRQAYQEEAWLNRPDSYESRRPIPQCHHRRQAGYDEGDPRFFGNVQAVSARDYDYDSRSGQRRNGNFVDRVFDFVGSFARGVGDLAYDVAPAVSLWAQVKYGGVGGHYFGGYDNGYYNQRPYNPWNSRQNRDLIAYNNNSGYYDNRSYNDRYYQPSWLNG